MKRSTKPSCLEGKIIVRTDPPECEVSLNDQKQGVTDDNGQLAIPIASGRYNITVSKPGYDSSTKPVNLGCGKTETVIFKLNLSTITLSIRTNPPDCEILVNQGSKGRSDSQGLFKYPTLPGSILIEARKEGYLSKMKPIEATIENAGQEVTFTLEPIPASLKVTANVASARVRIGNQAETRALNESTLLPPGRYQITAEALGYEPASFEITLGPGEIAKREVSLQRLSPEELAKQAEKMYDNRAYANVFTLCNYIFEAEPGYGAAHRLAGLAYLAEQNYAKAAAHLVQALSSNETISLPVRRHAGENFDINRGHTDCSSILIMNKKEVEFRGLQAPNDNFKVTYDQIQMLGIQLKKNTAVYLSVKVTDKRGKGREFNFYSFDKELSQSGRAYLELLQHLLQSH